MGDKLIRPSQDAQPPGGLPAQGSIFNGDPGRCGRLDAILHASSDPQVTVNDGRIGNVTPGKARIDAALPLVVDMVTQYTRLCIQQVGCDGGFAFQQTVPDTDATVYPVPPGRTFIGRLEDDAAYFLFLHVLLSFCYSEQ